MLRKISLILKKILFLAPDESGTLLPSFIAAVLFGFCWGIVLIGIPGALIMVAAQVVLTKLGIAVATSSEATWGVVIAVSFAMPLSIPAAHVLVRAGLPRTFRSLIALTGVWWLFLGVVSAITPTK